MTDEIKNPAAVELGKLGGQKTAARGPEYYAEIQAQRRTRAGGRPKAPPIAAYPGVLKIGDMRIDVAVLDDGRRVLSHRGLGRVIGRGRGGKDWKSAPDGAGQMPFFLTAKNLIPYISDDLRAAVSNEILYRDPLNPANIAKGIEAGLLPKICEVWLDAWKAGAIKREAQKKTVSKAEMLYRGIAQVGIVALIDEATGYQQARARNALEEILDRFLRKELGKWAKRFPDEFYENICRLKGLEYKEGVVRRNQIFGKLTNQLVYSRLAPAVLEELQAMNPKDERGRRKNKHHQWLTEDVGHPRLREHLASVITLMRVSPEWETFIRMMDQALPAHKKIKRLPLFDVPEPRPADAVILPAGQSGGPSAAAATNAIPHQ